MTLESTTRNIENLKWAAIISLVTFLLMLANFLLDGPLVKADEWLSEQLAGSALYSTMAVITHLGSFLFVSIVSATLILFMLGQDKTKLAMLWLATMLGGYLLISAIKMLVQRARPEHLIEASGFSFPSGHAAGATMFYLLLIYTYNKHIPFKKWFIAACIGILVLVGATRLFLSVHWLTDVIAGFSLGIFWTSTCILVSKSAIADIKK